jgi:hypothetical protein
MRFGHGRQAHFGKLLFVAEAMTRIVCSKSSYECWLRGVQTSIVKLTKQFAAIGDVANN